MDTNQTHETSMPDADNCGALRTISGQEVHPVDLPVQSFNEPTGLPREPWRIDKDGVPHRNTPLPEATFKGVAESPTPLSERMRSHLHTQFPATVGHIPLTAMLAQVADLERERKNSLSERLTPEILRDIVRVTQGRVGKEDLDHLADALLETKRQLAEARRERDKLPTPETDALVPTQGNKQTMLQYIKTLEAHSRDLENERDNARDSVKKWEGDYRKAMESLAFRRQLYRRQNALMNEMRDRLERDANQWETQCRVARIQRDRLAEAVRELLKGTGACPSDAPESHGSIPIRQALRALASVDGGTL